MKVFFLPKYIFDAYLLTFILDDPFLYEYTGSNLELTRSELIGIKLNSLNLKHHATRQHKRDLVNFINKYFGSTLMG